MPSKLLKLSILCFLFSTVAYGESTIDEKEKQTILLKNIENLIDNNELTTALDHLDKIDIKNLTSKQVAKYQMLRANLFFKDVDMDTESEVHIDIASDNEANKNLSPDTSILAQSATSDIESDSFQESFSLNNAADSASYLSTESVNTDKKNSINNKNIWQKLVTQNLHNLDAISTDLQNDSLKPKTKKILGSNKESLAGWVELATITKKAFLLSNDDFYKNIVNWQKKFTTHPAANYINADFNYDFESDNVNKIVVLLPDSGALAKTANAIKEGIITAHFQNPNPLKPELVFINSINKPENIIQEYQTVLKLNPDLIIGPLNKESVEILAKQVRQNSPAIVALNYTSSTQQMRNNFYQFGLSAEDESEQAAEKAWNDGVRKAMILVDDNPWGMRVSNSYKNIFEQSGGTITKIIKIKANDNLKRLINNVIATEQSQDRKNSLEVVLNQKINFQPRHRKDFDHIFIATSPTIAKQIKPILKFYYADYIPVFATSNIYTYTSNNSKTMNDLEGIQFCDIPWIVNQDDSRFNDNIHKLKKLRGKDFDNFIRLYALGMDAYELSYNLNKLNYSTRIGVASNTGHLYKDSNNKIHRLLSWATIENGKIKMLDVLA